MKIEKIYIANGLENFKLENLDDLAKCHGIDYKNITGYNRLNELNKSIFEEFLINFFNMNDIEQRENIEPIGICLVESKTYFRKENDELIHCGEIVYAIDSSGLRVMIENTTNKNFKMIEGKSENYLRFEYKYYGIKKWLHVEEDEWY